MRVRVLIAILLLLVILLLDVWPRSLYLPESDITLQVQRFETPVIHARFDPAMRALIAYDGGNNINGPSLIRVPAWVGGPKGRYYLYFAHHKGKHIRMAYADSLQGPWRLYRPGVLQIQDAAMPASPAPLGLLVTLKYWWQHYPLPVLRDQLRMAWQAGVVDKAERARRGEAFSQAASAHIASPEIIVDNENQRLLMLYHGLDDYGVQSSRLAVSREGLHFSALASQVDLPGAYLRSFDVDGVHYLLGMPGMLFRAESRHGPFELRRRPLLPANARHAAVLRCDRVLHVFWSRVGDAPERLLHSVMPLVPNWETWKISAPRVLMQARYAWEGSQQPIQASLRGEQYGLVNQLRDPALMRDKDGSVWLAYSGGGEQAIGLARLDIPDCENAALPPKPQTAAGQEALIAVI